MLIKRQYLLPILLLALTACRSTATATLDSTGSTKKTTLAPLPSPTATHVPTPTPPPTATLSTDTSFIGRPTEDSIRVMSYNINWDSIFPENDPKNHSFREFSLGDEFERVMRAIMPDIVCLQEIHHIRTSEELGNFLAAAMDDERRWQVVNVRDNVIATHFALNEKGYELFTLGIRPSMAQAAALIDLPDERFATTDLYMICSHFKAAGGFGDIKERGRQADVIMRQVRDFKTPGDNLDLPINTPFLILGDLNVYDTDPALHLQTLLTGDIQNEDSYGEDISPDWDETFLEDALPSHNGLGTEFYTWRADTSPFNPGPLDRILYSDSVLQLANAYVLNTTLLTDEALTTIGLERYDVVLDPASNYFDHLPIVVDFIILNGD